MTKVLRVEDNEMNRDMLSRRLKRKGFEVLIAVDGLEGVNMAQSELPEIILLDMSLPVMDGWEAAGKLKADPEQAAAFVNRCFDELNLSGASMVEEVHRGYVEIGVDVLEPG